MAAKTEQQMQSALEWAAREVDDQLRSLNDLEERMDEDHEWSLDVPNGVGIYVAVIHATVEASTVVLTIQASTTGVVRRRELEWTLRVTKA